MKNKFITLLLISCMALSIVACGDSGSSDSQQSDSQNEQNDTSEQQEEQNEQEDEVDDGIINFDGEGYNITYVKHELSEDYEGNPCLLVYYTYTNNGEEASSAAVNSYLQVFQNGIQCDTAILMDSPDAYGNYMKDIQPGYSIEVCQAFCLEDTSDVTLEASELISFDDKKDVQIIVLE